MKKLLFLPLLVLLLWQVPSYGNSAQNAEWARGYEAWDNDNRKAFQIWKPLAESGHVKSQYWLGTLYFKGEGVAKDKSEAKKWFLKAAEQGNVPAKIYIDHENWE